MLRIYWLICSATTAVLAATTLVVLPFDAMAQVTITEVIDSSGDGIGNELGCSSGVAVDAAGNVYVTGWCSDNAFRITPAGTITEIIDASGDGAGNILDRPDGAKAVAVDAAGNVYVTGLDSDNAFRITPAGTITELIDASGDGAGNVLDSASSVAVDNDGNVYVTGWQSDNAFQITPAGTITQIIDTSGDGAGNPLYNPFGIAVDDAGNVFVAGFNSHNVFKITPSGKITEIIDASGDGAGNTLSNAWDVTTDVNGNVYVTGIRSDNAFQIRPDGVVIEILDASGDGAGNFPDEPRAIAVDLHGTAYVAGNFLSHSVFQITSAGTITEIIDEAGDGAGNSLLDPYGIGVDEVGNIYVAGKSTSNVFRITPSSLLCEVSLSQRTYGLDETLEMLNLRFANTGLEPLLTRLRLQLLSDTFPFTADFVDVGAGGSFGLPVGFDNDFGPVTLFSVAPIMPQGTWTMRCALEDPITGVVRAEGFYPFEVK